MDDWAAASCLCEGKLLRFITVITTLPVTEHLKGRRVTAAWDRCVQVKLTHQEADVNLLKHFLTVTVLKKKQTPVAFNFTCPLVSERKKITMVTLNRD